MLSVNKTARKEARRRFLEQKSKVRFIARRDSEIVPIHQCCVSVLPSSVIQNLKNIIDRDAGGALSRLHENVFSLRLLDRFCLGIYFTQPNSDI